MPHDLSLRKILGKNYIMWVDVLQVVRGCDTAGHGREVLSAIEFALKEGPVTVNFEDCESVTPSFVNGCFRPLLHKMSYEDFKKNIKIVDLHKQGWDVIKAGVKNELDRIKGNRKPSILDFNRLLDQAIISSIECDGIWPVKFTKETF